MRVICPHCQKNVTLADSLAGQSAQCPECKNLFTAPSMMTPQPPPVAVVATPVAPVTIEPAPLNPNVPPTAAPPAPGTSHTWHLSLAPNILRWVGPIALVVLFFATFFTWVGSYAGSAVYTQSAWGAAFGTFSTDPLGDEVMRSEDDLKKQNSSSAPMMVTLILLLLPALAIAVFELLQDRLNITVPDALNSVWPHRHTALTLASILIFVLLAAQSAGGIGLENAAAKVAEVRHPLPATETSKPEPGTKAVTKRDLEIRREYNAFGLKRGFGECVGFSASLVAALAFALETWLQRRGNRRLPAIEIQW